MNMTSGAERGTADHNNNQGSLENSEPVFICIGKIHRAHGIKGDVILDPMTDFPERIRRGKSVYAGETHQPLTVDRVRSKPPFLLVGFKEISDETAASEYYFHELIGLEAVNLRNEHVGTLTEILETGANDVYVIRRDDGTEELVPDIPQYIRNICIPEHRIQIDFPEWL